VRVTDAKARIIDYRLNILGVRVWENACQLIARNHDGSWGPIGPRWDLPVHVPVTAEELKAASLDTLRLTASQYDAERSGSDLREVLSGSKDFRAALSDGAAS
jgi:hypothetical protein